MPVSPAYIGYFHRDNKTVRAVCELLDREIQKFPPGTAVLNGAVTYKEAVSREELAAIAQLYFAAGWGVVGLSGLSGDQRLHMPKGTVFFTLQPQDPPATPESEQP